MIGAIWAQTADRVIGRDGKVPWRYPGDLARFKRVTMGAAVVMGRRTYESIGRPLPGRLNLVVTSQGIQPPLKHPIQRLNKVTSICCPIGVELALRIARQEGYNDVWFIGGARIYEAALALPELDVIDVTLVPDVVPVEGSVLAPTIDESAFALLYETPHSDEPSLTVHRYQRRQKPYDLKDNRAAQDAGAISRRRP